MAGTAATPAAKPGIELLSTSTPTGKSRAISFWARTAGIPLIIFLQLAFLSIFAFRAKLEMDLKSLTASLAEKEKIVAGASEFEEDFRQAQLKLEKITQVRQELCYSCAIEKLSEIKPAGVIIINRKLEGNKLEIVAESPQGASFPAFVANIFTEKAIRQASLTSGALSREGRFVFTLELTLDKEELR